jgi:AcrR family transcriptional regulator
MNKATKKADVRRQAILEAAASCLREKGFRATSIAEVCKAAGVSAGHLYYYFDSKEALVEAIVDQLITWSHDELTRILQSDDPLGALIDHELSVSRPEPLFGLDDAVELDLFAEAARNPRIAALLQQQWRNSRDWVRQVIVATQAKGQMPVNLDVEQAVALICLTVTNVSSVRVADPAFDPELYRKALRGALYAAD